MGLTVSQGSIYSVASQDGTSELKRNSWILLAIGGISIYAKWLHSFHLQQLHSSHTFFGCCIEHRSSGWHWSWGGDQWLGREITEVTSGASACNTKYIIGRWINTHGPLNGPDNPFNPRSHERCGACPFSQLPCVKTDAYGDRVKAKTSSGGWCS